MKIIIMMAAPVLFFLLVIVAATGGGSTAATPVNAVSTEEKAEEYATMASKMGAPWEIVIITDAIDAESNKKPGIEDVNPMYTTLEFLFLDITVEHYEIVGWQTDSEGNSYPVYDWVYNRTDRYTGKTEILNYIGITDRQLGDLSPEKLIEITNNVALSNSNAIWRYFIDYSANADFETVLRDYVKMKEEDIEKVLELYNSNYLQSWLSEEILAKINDIKAQYGMYQMVADDGTYTNYDGIVFSDGVIEVVYYNQGDARWKNDPYGTDNIGGYACGPTSMAIVISTLTDSTYDPVYMANWAYQNGYWCKGSGSYHSLIPGAAQAFGLDVSGCTAAEPQRIIDALSEEKLIVVLMSKGHFTSGGHFMVLRGVTSDGKILVADPGSHSRSQQAWNFSIILNEARKGAGAGGPFWIIG